MRITIRESYVNRLPHSLCWLNSAGACASDSSNRPKANLVQVVAFPESTLFADRRQQHQSLGRAMAHARCSSVDIPILSGQMVLSPLTLDGAFPTQHAGCN